MQLNQKEKTRKGVGYLKARKKQKEKHNFFQLYRYEGKDKK